MLHGRSYPVRRGFTLVELLVVFGIIGVLVALLIPTIAAAVRRTRFATIAVELQDLASAVEAYKSWTGDYPPDFTNANAVIDHMRKAFPRNTRKVAVGANPSAVVFVPPIPNAPDPANLDPAEALVFWLSLLSNNARDPLAGVDAAYAGERKVLRTFDPTRLVDLDGDSWMELVPPHATESPYVYFDGRVIGGGADGSIYAYATAAYPKQAVQFPPVFTDGTVVRPYRSNVAVVPARDHNRTRPYNKPVDSNLTEWIKPGQFQILCAGMDGDYGGDSGDGSDVIYRTYPLPNYSLVGAVEDNLANFSEMKTMGDSVP